LALLLLYCYFLARNDKMNKFRSYVAHFTLRKCGFAEGNESIIAV
jgi:hypothetical protein